ncbi:MAG: ABC transporter ATP-binding protein [Clostridia bacterium]|nr:ABC transporter ATP-binding protein [Clostridia bacterium]
MKSKKNKLAESFGIFALIGKYEPCYLAFSIPQMLLASVLTVFCVYFPKLFIEQLESGGAYRKIAVNILLYIAIMLVIKGLQSFFGNKSTFYIERFSKKIQKKAGELTMALPLESMEGANFSDKLAMANNVSQTIGALGILQSIISNIITIAGLSAIITSLDIIFIITVGIVLLIKILFVYLTYRHNKKRRKEYAANDRVGDYLSNVAYFNPGAAKELRINNIGDWFMTKISGYREKMLRMQYGDFGRGALFECISAVIMAVQSFVILAVLSSRVIDGFIGIADFTMYFSAVTVLTSTLSAIVGEIGEYNRQQLYLSDFDALAGDKKHYESSDTMPAGLDIVFENVSFKYPNTEKYVLENINIRIPAGEKLSVVGKNGAGKSTFIKLLCRFYKPTKGRITIGGVDIENIGDEEYNKLIAAVFQDYQNLAFTIGENVSMGRAKNNVELLLCDIGLGTLISRLPNGADTYLTRSFDSNGVELSGGEGQKLAIARAVYKNSPILILDEPTAALDPKAESEIYDSYFRIAAKKTTIFISHRLSSSTVADKIALFENGKIMEYGTHTELMKNDGEYARMFDLQKKAYAEA